jgi:hypothetical protein
MLMTLYMTKTKQTLKEFNNWQPSIKFTIRKGLREDINFLNLTIHRKDKKLKFSTYRKPTQTDVIIPNSSCHPYEHKLSGINCILNQLHTYAITKIAKQTEINTIKNILWSNEYNTNPIEKPLPQQQNIHTDP